MTTLALVTGGNRGIGLATARALAEHGVHVIIGARQEAAGRAAATVLQEAGHSAEHIVLDVDDPASVRAAAHQIDCRHGRLDILVNNAGILPEATTPMTEIVDVSVFRRTFETNLFGAVATTEAFLPLMRAPGRARIVNVSSIMGSLTDQTNASSPYYDTVVPAYQASKAALNSLTVGLSKLLAGTEIDVVAVCPGFVQTELTPINREQAPRTAEEAGRTVAEVALAPSAESSNRFVDAGGPLPW